MNSVNKWIPAGVAVLVVAGAAVAIPAAANASVSLPSKTPAQVLELVESSNVKAFSGEITETSDLGLPSLSASGIPGGGSVGGSSSSSIASDLALLTGTNSLRVYVDGPKNIRLQNLESLGELDVIRSGSNVWTYDAKSNSVEHLTLPATSGQHFGKPVHAPVGSDKGTQTANNSVAPTTPEAFADELLATVGTTSTVTVADNIRVAGRPAYNLVLTPKASDTLVGSVSIAVDAATGLPLQVRVDAAGQKTPAITIGFTSLDLAAPSASLFDFMPPSGATVKQVKTDGDGSKRAHSDGSSAPEPKPSVTGTGWDAVVTIPAGSSSKNELGELTKSPDFAELTEAVSDGRVLHTSLFTVLFTSDGRILAGAVSAARLEAVAAQ